MYAHPASDGLRKFIRSLGLNMQSYQLRQMSDEADLVDALESIKYYFHSYVSLHGALTPAAMDNVRKDMEEYMLKGANKQEDTLKWSRNAGMYVLVIDPTLTLLNELTITTAHLADDVVNKVITMVKEADMYGEHDDAVVAREQIRHIIAKYRETTPTVAQSKKPRKLRKRRVIADYADREEDNYNRFSSEDSNSTLDFN